MFNLSFQEKSAWGTLAASLVVGALYFSSVWNLWRGDLLDAPVMLKLALGYTVFLVVVLVAYHVLAASLSRPEDEDERDRLIGWRAAAAGGLVMGFGVMAVVVQIVLEGLFGGFLTDSPILIANALLLVVLIATVVELAIKLYFYRRGF